MWFKKPKHTEQDTFDALRRIPTNVLEEKYIILKLFREHCKYNSFVIVENERENKFKWFRDLFGVKSIYLQLMEWDPFMDVEMNNNLLNSGWSTTEYKHFVVTEEIEKFKKVRKLKSSDFISGAIAFGANMIVFNILVQGVSPLTSIISLLSLFITVIGNIEIRRKNTKAVSDEF